MIKKILAVASLLAASVVVFSGVAFAAPAQCPTTDLIDGACTGQLILPGNRYPESTVIEGGFQLQCKWCAKGTGTDTVPCQSVLNNLHWTHTTIWKEIQTTCYMKTLPTSGVPTDQEIDITSRLTYVPVEDDGRWKPHANTLTCSESNGNAEYCKFQTPPTK